MRNDKKFVTQGQLRKELKALEGNLTAKIVRSSREMGVEFEKLRHDVLGAIGDMYSLFKDKTLEHDGRIKRLERYAGFVR